MSNGTTLYVENFEFRRLIDLYDIESTYFNHNKTNH